MEALSAADLSPARDTTPGAALARAHRVAEHFEAIFVQQMVTNMRESTDLAGEGGMFGSGPGSSTYAQWFDTYMSEHLAATGEIGVADAILAQLERTGQLPPGARGGQR
jgi:Rod binding domain-containing protein